MEKPIAVDPPPLQAISVSGGALGLHSSVSDFVTTRDLEVAHSVG